MTVTLNDNRGFWALVLLILSIVLLVLLRRCDPKQPAPINIPEYRIKDSFRVVIKYHDSTRLHHLNKWRTITHINDSTPCYTEVRTVIAYCDTVIKYDSILISSLKDQANNDSVIIFKQGLMIRADSIHIAKLNKKVKRNRRIALGLGAVLAGAVGVKVID